MYVVVYFLNLVITVLVQVNIINALFLLQPRPPLYNPEDYAMSLKKWSRRAEESKQPPSIIALSTPQPGEMSLRQFASVTDLLNKLKMDLKLALARYVSIIYVNPTFMVENINRNPIYLLQ